jgi:hypothetical protein
MKTNHKKNNKQCKVECILNFLELLNCFGVIIYNIGQIYYRPETLRMLKTTRLAKQNI